MDFEERGETQEGREGGKWGSGKKVREGRKGRRKEEERRSEEKVREELWEERRKWWRSVELASRREGASKAKNWEGAREERQTRSVSPRSLPSSLRRQPAEPPPTPCTC